MFLRWVRVPVVPPRIKLMLTLKMLKEKLDNFRSKTGLLFEVSFDKNGNITLDTGMKMKDVSNSTDNAEVVSSFDGSSI